MPCYRLSSMCDKQKYTLRYIYIYINIYIYMSTYTIGYNHHLAFITREF